MSKTLITGFAGLNGEINASAELIASLTRDLPDALLPHRDKLCFEILSCLRDDPEAEHIALQRELRQIITQHAPAICIFTGQAPSHNRVRIERFAVNHFYDKPIDKHAPAGYAANLPRNEELASLLNSYDIPAALSNYAGKHACNHILFSFLHLAQQQSLDCKAGFIHIPVLPVQVANADALPLRDSPFMLLEQTRMAMAYIVRHVLNSQEQA